MKLEKFKIVDVKDLDVLTALAANDNQTYELLDSIDAIQMIVAHLVQDEGPALSSFCFYLYNLSKAPQFVLKYAPELPIKLYKMTIKHRSKELALNSDLTIEAIDLVLETIKNLALSSSVGIEEISNELK